MMLTTTCRFCLSLYHVEQRSRHSDARGSRWPRRYITQRMQLNLKTIGLYVASNWVASFRFVFNGVHVKTRLLRKRCWNPTLVTWCIVVHVVVCMFRSVLRHFYSYRMKTCVFLLLVVRIWVYYYFFAYFSHLLFRGFFVRRLRAKMWGPKLLRTWTGKAVRLFVFSFFHAP